MARSNKLKPYNKFILLSLFEKDGLTLKELDEREFLLSSRYGGFHSGHRKRKKERNTQSDTLEKIKILQETGLIQEKDNRYYITIKGKEIANEFSDELNKARRILSLHFLSPVAAARNTIFIDLFLAVIKIISGAITGSIGLIADGADAAIDTISACVVWASIRSKKEFLGELIIIAMMIVTSVSVGFESISTLYDDLVATIAPISRPYLVIMVESVSCIFAALLYYYQRYVGKKKGSFTLITQSVDSKNHIYVAIAIIMGAVFSIFGIHYVDAIIGVAIAARILLDAKGLFLEYLSRNRGEKVDMEKYEIPLEKRFKDTMFDSYRTWVLYTLNDLGPLSKKSIESELSYAYNDGYVSLVGDIMSTPKDFNSMFDEIIAPLITSKEIICDGDTYSISKDGIKHLNKSTLYHRYMVEM